MQPILALVFLAPAALAQSVLRSTAEGLGSAVGVSAYALGGVDLDSVADLVVGAPSKSSGGPTTLFQGYSVSRMGEANLDGVPGFFVLSAEVKLSAGRPSVRLGVDGSELHAFEDDFAYSSPADDVEDADRDEIADCIVGSFGYPIASHAVRVWVCLGATGAPIHVHTGDVRPSIGKHSPGRAAGGTDRPGRGRAW